MAEFKPMVKMMTTEPSIELKLKKGGSVKKADGGAMVRAMPSTMPSSMPGLPARGGALAAASPMKPSMAARRRAMTLKEGGESKAEHKAEMGALKGLKKELKSHEGKPASKGHKGLATGGVVDGQGGFKKGGSVKKMATGGLSSNGIIKNEAGAATGTKMDTAHPDKSKAATGSVKLGNGGGFATGGVAKANGGGYKKGGSAKKAYAAGGVVDSGRPVAMPQGKKPIPKPVSINQLSGTYKKGGSVTPAQGRLQAINKAENATAMREAKADSNEYYGPGSKAKKFAKGGTVDLSKGAYDKALEQEDMDIANAIRNAPSEAFGTAKKWYEDFADKVKDKPFGDISKNVKPVPMGSVTKTEKSVTVSPGKKRGGSVKC